MHAMRGRLIQKMIVNTCSNVVRKVGGMLIRKHNYSQIVIWHERDISRIAVRVALVENKAFVMDLTNKPPQPIACPRLTGYVDVGCVHPLQVSRIDQSRTAGGKTMIEKQQHP